jgi:hypothetical protein
MCRPTDETPDLEIADHIRGGSARHGDVAPKTRGVPGNPLASTGTAKSGARSNRLSCLPAGMSFTPSVEAVPMAVSPDGRTIAVIAVGDAARQVFVRRLDDTALTPIRGTDGARAVFWSPDGSALAFVAGNKIKRLTIGQPTAVSLFDVPDAIGVAGRLGRGRTDRVQHRRRPCDLEGIQCRRGSPRPRPTRELLRGADSFGEFVEPGYLVSGHDGALVARRFDLSTGQLQGEPMPHCARRRRVPDHRHGRVCDLAHRPRHLSKRAQCLADDLDRSAGTACRRAAARPIHATAPWLDYAVAPDARRLLVVIPEVIASREPLSVTTIR